MTGFATKQSCFLYAASWAAPSAHMIKLTATQEITPPYRWVHPEEER
jgi:hypothetical protein